MCTHAAHTHTLRHTCTHTHTHMHTQHAHTHSQTNPSATFEQAPLQDQHVTMLQQQLASTSNICGELLQGQNTLIHAICQRLDNLDLETTIQGHLEHLHLYQMELEQYHQVLYFIMEIGWLLVTFMLITNLFTIIGIGIQQEQR